MTAENSTNSSLSASFRNSERTKARHLLDVAVPADEGVPVAALPSQWAMP